MSEEEIEEGEVVTYYQLREIYGGDDSKKELKKLTLRCINCDHIDTVIGMRQRKDKKRIPSPDKDKDKPNPSPFNPGDINPSPWRIKWQKQYTADDSNANKIKQNIENMKECVGEKLKHTTDDDDGYSLISTGYKEEFECPNCSSSAVTLTEKSYKIVTARLL